MAFRTFLRRLPALALATAFLAPAPLAAQPPMPDYSLPPDSGRFMSADPAVVARCVHQVRMAGVRWDAYNDALNQRIAVARRLPVMSELERSVAIRQISLAIETDSRDKVELQRALDLLLDARARDAGAYGAGLRREYLEEMRRKVEDARESWHAGMMDCIATATAAASTPGQQVVVPVGPAAPGDGSWSGTYVSRAYPTTFNFTGGGSALSATFDGRFSDTHNNGAITNCRRGADGGFDCDYTYRHEDSQKTGQVSGRMHLTHADRCTITEGESVITAVELKSLDGSPATSPSLYVGARGGGNTYDRQGCR